MKESQPGSLLALGALGVVYGDIGTSPLYALRQTMGDLPISMMNVLGVLSLVFWSLILLVSIKCISLVFRADNEGEGGILALLALLKQHAIKKPWILYGLAMLGAGFLLGDGMLTPAISVISAVEGIGLIYPHMQHWVVGFTCVILFLLFAFQRCGSSVIGKVFGPVILVWFLVIAMLGAIQIAVHPEVIWAVNPYYAYAFLSLHGWHGYFLLGGVFLVATGGEALYADIGHFGKKPIRQTWFMLVLPCLLLNYFGQGAKVLADPGAMLNPFYQMVPPAFLGALIVLATLATIIASQAIISATFSLIRQGIVLGLFPRMPIVQTSKELIGQIYIPQMNFILMVGAILLVLFFHDSSRLAHAYGIGVNLEMMLVTLMVACAARRVWQWSVWLTAVVFGFFIGIDMLFLGANAHKFMTGGWVPVCFALLVAFTMFTWRNGFEYLQKTVYRQHPEIEGLSRQLTTVNGLRLQGTNAVFVTDHYDHSGGSFLHFLKVSLGFAENILIVNCRVANQPYVHHIHRFSVRQLEVGMYELSLHYGFMEHFSIPQALIVANSKGLLPFWIEVEHMTYWVELLQVVASRSKKTLWFYRQEQFFAFLARNYSVNLNIEFYRLPYEKTIAIGTYTLI